MIIDISNDEILQADCLGFFLGIPQTKAVCTGDLIAKDFKLPDVPIYPTQGMGVLATEEDVIAYSRVITAGTPPAADTVVDTVVEIDELTEMTDYPGLYEGFSLTAVPTGADAIVADYAELLEPFIAQGVEPKITQKTEEVSRINSTDTMTAYGNIKIDIKSEQIMSLNTISYIQKLMFREYAGIKTPVEGYKAFDLRPRPMKVYGYENIRWDDDLVGRLYFEDVTIAADLPNAKSTGNVGFTLQMNVAKLPRLVIPDTD